VTAVITAAGHRYQAIPVRDEELVAMAAHHADALMVSGLALEAA
jgi:hypothetical protein